MDIVLGKILKVLFGGNAQLGTLIISMCPLIELKGGIPIGMSRDLWGKDALVGIQAFLLSLVGSSIVIFALPILFDKIIRLLKKVKGFRGIALSIESRTVAKSQKISSKKNSIFFKCLSVFLFVALPLPLTGVWTGSCVAVALKLNYWQAVTSVFFGNLVAGLIVYFVCRIFPAFTMWLIYIVIVIFAISLTVFVVKAFTKRNVNNSNE